MQEVKEKEVKTTKGVMQMSKVKFWGLMALSFFLGALFMSMGETPDTTNKTTETETAQTTNSQPTQAPTLEPTVAEKTYQEIFLFDGNGAKTSEPFTITGDRFKVKYDCTGELCQAYLYEVGNDLPKQLIMNSTEPLHSETIVYGAGEYYITSNTIGNFWIIVEDYK